MVIAINFPTLGTDDAEQGTRNPMIDLLESSKDGIIKSLMGQLRLSYDSAKIHKVCNAFCLTALALRVLMLVSNSQVYVTRY